MAMEIESDMSGGVRNVAITNCVFDGTDAGVSMKTRRGRGNVVEAVRVGNLVMKGTFNPMGRKIFHGSCRL